MLRNNTKTDIDFTAWSKIGYDAKVSDFYLFVASSVAKMNVAIEETDAWR